MKTVIRQVRDFVPADLWGTPAGDVIKRDTAKLRHEDRFKATRECAQAHIENLRCIDRWEPVARDAAVALLLYVDYLLPGKHRHEAFATLGTGYRHDLDGPAFMAAQRDAIRASHWDLSVTDEEPYLAHVQMCHKDTTKVVLPPPMLQSVLGVGTALDFAVEMIRFACRENYRPLVFSVLKERPTLSAASALYNAL